MPFVATSGRRLVPSNSLAVGARLGYLAAFAIAMASWQAMDAERMAAARDRFGAALADELAQLAVEPLLRQDRIGLGLLANRVAAYKEVRRIAIYTVDDRPFVVAGDAPTPAAPTYVRPIAIQDTVAGRVRVMLNADEFALPAWRLPAQWWSLWLAGLAFVVAGCRYGRRVYGRGVALWNRVRGHGTAALPAEVADTALPANPDETYLLVANLFQSARMADDARARAIRRGLAVAKRVADLYGGHAEELPGTGILLRFAGAELPDRGFEAVCAALLVRQLLEAEPPALAESPNEGAAAAAGGLFRYGLDLASSATGHGQGVIESSAAMQDAVLLSSLAPNGALALGQAALAAIARPERLLLDEFENPAAQALPTTAAPSGMVRGAVPGCQALLDRQAEIIAAALAPSLD